MNILKALLRRSWLALLCTVLVAAAVFPLESWAEESPAVPVESAESKTDTDDTVATTGPVIGSLEIICMDKYEEIYLSGAGYRIYDSDGKQVAEGYTNGFGRLFFGDIPRGSYTYQEFKAPQGFEPDDTEHSFEIRKNGETVSQIRVSERRPGTIKVKKRDTDGNSLAGVAFLLEFSTDKGSTWLPVFTRDEAETNIVRGGCTSPGLVDGQLSTDEFGMVQFTGLRADSKILYRLTETAVPEGYSPMEGSHYVGTLPIRTENIYASDAEVFGTYAYAYTLRVAASNDPVFRLPDAGASGFGYLPFAMLLCAAPIPIIIKTKQKKRRFTSMKKLFALLLALVMVCSLSIPAFAAPVDEAIIDMSRTGNIDLWKYDLTNGATRS